MASVTRQQLTLLLQHMLLQAWALNGTAASNKELTFTSTEIKKALYLIRIGLIKAMIENPDKYDKAGKGQEINNAANAKYN